jgi:hypothetical protein
MRQDKYFDRFFKRILNETLENKADELMEKLKFNPPGSSFDYVQEGNVCEQCGSEMNEGECMECGMREGEIMEKLHGGQKKLDKNRNGKIDDEDFKILRSKKERKEGKGECMECGKSWMDEEVEEGNAFTGMLAKTKKGDKFKLGDKTYTDKSSLDGKKTKGKVDETLYRLKYIDDTALFTEEEIIDIIEGIIKEENNIKNTPTPPGTTYYQKAHKGSGKEEDDYMKSLVKKMKDYLKDGSNGEYDMNPKHFPKGNGQLEKMKAKKYTMSDDGKDFLDDFMRPGMENLDYDEIHPDEDWMKDNIEGSSRTGNNPKWANAEETELGEKINKKRKTNKYAQAKRTAYRKSKQPVTDGTGENAGKGVDIKLESTNEKQNVKLNEEFNRMVNLMNYDNKTQ